MCVCVWAFVSFTCNTEESVYRAFLMLLCSANRSLYEDSSQEEKHCTFVNSSDNLCLHSVCTGACFFPVKPAVIRVLPYRILTVNNCQTVYAFKASTSDI